MILWLTGNSGAGKTTLAKKLAGKNSVVLDGDEMRGAISNDLGLSSEDRREHCLRVARLAVVLESQGLAVIVSVICPFENLRNEVQTITDCSFIYLPGGKEGVEYPYEIPACPAMTVHLTHSVINK